MLNPCCCCLVLFLFTHPVCWSVAQTAYFHTHCRTWLTSPQYRADTADTSSSGFSDLCNETSDWFVKVKREMEKRNSQLLESTFKTPTMNHTPFTFNFDSRGLVRLCSTLQNKLQIKPSFFRFGL